MTQHNQTDRILLDDPDDVVEPEGELEFPAIEPQRFADPYSGVVVTFEVIEYDDPKLIVVHGNPAEEVFHRYKLDIPEQFLFRLATDFIEPLRKFRELENLDTAERMRREHQEAEAELATYAFRASTTGLGGTRRDFCLRVHLRDCRHAIAALAGKGHAARDRVDIPLRNGVQLGEQLKKARTELQDCLSPRYLQSNASRAQAKSVGRSRHTALDYQPIRFCGTCKPLGELTSSANATVLKLANLTAPDDTAERDIAELFESIDTALWQSEQEHLDTVHGKGSGDTGE